ARAAHANLLHMNVLRCFPESGAAIAPGAGRPSSVRVRAHSSQNSTFAEAIEVRGGLRRYYNANPLQRSAFSEDLSMARGVNKVILVGNLGADPETRAMPS